MLKAVNQLSEVITSNSVIKKEISSNGYRTIMEVFQKIEST